MFFVWLGTNLVADSDRENIVISEQWKAFLTNIGDQGCVTCEYQVQYLSSMCWLLYKLYHVMTKSQITQFLSLLAYLEAILITF